MSRALGVLVLTAGCTAVPHEAPVQKVSVVDLDPGLRGCSAWSDGHVECWLGGGAAIRVEDLSDAVEVEVFGQRRRACARRRGGEVSCWSLDDAERPSKLEGASEVIKLASERDLLCTLARSGEIACTRADHGHRVEMTIPGATDLDIGSDLCAVTGFGEVRCLGASETPTVITGTEGATALALGMPLGCAIVAKGDVVCWEPALPDSELPAYDSPIQTPQRVPLDDEVTELVTEDDVACARTRAGAVSCWGDALWLHAGPTPTRVPALDGTSRLILSTQAACGWLGASSELGARCIDGDGDTPIDVKPRAGSPPTTVDAGERLCGRSPLGDLHCGDRRWPAEELGDRREFAGGCTVQDGRAQCQRPSYAAIVAPSADPEGGPDLQPPHSIGGVDDALAVASGSNFTCALRADRSVWCWGANTLGQSGVARPFIQAKRVLGVHDAVSLDVGLVRACAIERGGALKCWRPSSTRRVGLLSSQPRRLHDRPRYERYATEPAATMHPGLLTLGATVDEVQPGRKPRGPWLFEYILGEDGRSECHGACPEMPHPYTCVPPKP